MIDYHRALIVGLVLAASRSNSPTLAAAQVNSTEHQIFADELTAILYTQDNECSSALGVSMAFSLVYPGCTGDAIDQVRDVLGYPTGSNMQLVWEETTKRMLSNAGGQCAGDSWGGVCNSAAPLLKIANSVWFDDGGTLNADYESVVGSYAKQIDFQADDSPVLVNEWVNNSTNGLIDSIVPEDNGPLYPPYVLIAINSIYLKARWKEQFEEYNTNLDSFYSSASRTTEVSKAHFMNMVEYFDYSHEALPGYQVIDLPFAESQMSMIFVLPMSDDGEAVLSTELISALNDLQSTRVALSVPKFKFESEYEDNLKAGLIQIGIEAPFTEDSGALCGLFEDTEGCEKIVIDKVIQKTVIDVNEEGVEAAAVTAVMVGVTSAGPDDYNDPILMILDHPFQFFIYDKSEDLMLFEGRLGAPEIPETEPDVALLDSKHSDSDFWSNKFYVNPVAAASSSSSPQSTEASDSSTSQPAEASGASTTQPTEASGVSTNQSTTASDSSTTQPAEESGSSTSQVTEASGSSTTQPTEASGSSTTLPTEASGSSTTRPTEESGSSTTQPTEEPDPQPITSAGSISDRKLSSLCTCIFLAFALGFVS